MRVLNGGQNPAFSGESFSGVFVRNQFDMNDFQCDSSVELSVIGFVNRAHSTDAKLVKYDVAIVYYCSFRKWHLSTSREVQANGRRSASNIPLPNLCKTATLWASAVPTATMLPLAMTVLPLTLTTVISRVTMVPQTVTLSMMTVKRRSMTAADVFAVRKTSGRTDWHLLRAFPYEAFGILMRWCKCACSCVLRCAAYTLKNVTAIMSSWRVSPVFTPKSHI